MNSIEELALGYAREYLKDNEFNYIGNDEQIKARIDEIYSGGWESFYDETFTQEVA